MPKLRERKRGKEIGKGENRRELYEWSNCRVCLKPRWVIIIKGKIKNNRCKPCSDRERIKKYHGSGAKSNNWKGGEFNRYGYKYIWVSKRNPFYSMSVHNYIAEHRLVMAKILKRPLDKREIVHHKNGIRNDNRRDNLELTFRGKHALEHNKGYCDGFNKGYLEGIKFVRKENEKTP